MTVVVLIVGSACAHEDSVIAPGRNLPQFFMSLSPALDTLRVGERVLVKATLSTRTGVRLSDQTVVWSSSNPALAVVDSTGLVTAIASGDVAVIATSTVGVAGSAGITVSRAPVATIAITPSAGTLPIGTTVQLTATLRDEFGHVLPGRLVTWTSSDPALASVDGIGVVAGVRAGGPVVISATSEGQVGSAQVTVISFPPST
jgi:uncharacterized protein YjdB